MKEGRWRTHLRVGIVLTYRCNARCDDCNRYLQYGRIRDSDISLEELALGYEAMVKSPWEIEKVRLTGGEPLLHPKFVELMTFINETWNVHYVKGKARTVVFSNGIKTGPNIPGVRYAVARVGHKNNINPPAISPADLGYEPKCGVNGNYCHRQRGCGRLFDAFGFSFCVFAAPIGRVLGIDPYSSIPIRDGTYEICRHCVFGRGIKAAFRFFDLAKTGKIEYPTKTYRDGFDRWMDEGSPEFPRFAYRLGTVKC